MTLIATIIVTAEVVSFLILLSIFLGYQINFSEKKNKAQKRFLILLVVTMFGLLVDMSTFIIDAIAPDSILRLVASAFAFLMVDIILIVYTIYYKASIQDVCPQNKLKFVHVYVFIILDMIHNVISVFSKSMIKLTDSGTVFNYSIVLSGVLPICAILYLYVITIRMKNYLTITRLCSFYAYTAIVILPIIALAINPSWQFSYVAISLAECVIFIIITSKQVSDACQREKYFKTMNYIDALTGLNNRLAYNEAIENSKTHISVGIIYTDINGLKYTNDHIGHHAGDKLIKRYTQILTSTFQKEVVYRVGGDEFVVIIPDVELAKLKNLVTELHNKVMENNWIASVGYTSGKGVDVEELIMKAEKSMYAEKSNYHKAHSGNYSRV